MLKYILYSRKKYSGSKERYYWEANASVAAVDHVLTFDVRGADYISILISKYPNNSSKFDWGDTISSIGVSAYFTIKE